MSKADHRLHLYTVFLAISTLAVIVSGALITSEIAPGERQSPNNGVTGSSANYTALHRVVAIVAGALTIGLAVWLSPMKAPHGLRALSWIALAALAIDGAIGWKPPPLSPAFGFFHASLAHMFLAVIASIAVQTSPGWSRGPEPVDDRGWGALRPLAIAVPPAVFVQILLGAAYRHQLIGVILHIAGALVVALLTLIVSVVVLQHFPEHRPLRRAATALISIVIAQVCLGIAAFIMPLLGADNTLGLALATAGHVSVGALTLAASVAIAFQIRRDIRPRAQPLATRP